MPEDQPALPVEDTSEPAETRPYLVFKFPGDEQEFPSHPHFNLALLWKHKTAIASGQFEAIMLFAETMVLDEHRERLMDYLISHGNDELFLNIVYDALWETHLGMSNLPFPRPSGSSDSMSESDSPLTDDSPLPATEG